MNTWFRERKQYMSTWQHPATKKWHLIDYVVLRKSQYSVCTDVQVMRGANCWTDHRLVRMRVRLQFPKQKRESTSARSTTCHLQAKDEGSQD